MARLVTVAGVCRRRMSVWVCNTPRPACRRLQAMTSCSLQSNYSSTATLHGGPVRLRLVGATPCFYLYDGAEQFHQYFGYFVALLHSRTFVSRDTWLHYLLCYLLSLLFTLCCLFIALVQFWS